MELQVSSHFSKEPTTCPYPDPAETIPRKQPLFLSNSFYKKCVCASGHFLSGIRSKKPGPIILHSNSCHIHCQTHSSSCCSVPSTVFVSLKTGASILVLLGSGNLLAILLLIIERCVSAERYNQILATYTYPVISLWINKFYIIKEFQSFPTFNFIFWSCFLRNIQHITT